jgi:type IV pilus assembly protein PilN
MATRINLLDWRSVRRERRKKEFVVLMAISAALGALIVGAWMLNANGALSHQQARNTMLRNEIRTLDQQIAEISNLERTKENLLARMQVIESLQASRSATVHFFDQLVETLPDGVYLTSVRQQGTNITLEGVAESNARVSSYMKQLDASLWFDNPRLIVIRTTGQNRSRQSEFTLQVRSITAPTTTSGDAS